MRLFEIGLLLMVFCYSVRINIPKQSKIDWIVFSVISAIFFLLHVIFEQTRWNMIPIYVLLGVLVLIGFAFIIRVKKLKGKFKNRVLLMILLIVVTVATGLVPILLPVLHFPEPDGPYSVGVTSMEFVDESRDELFTSLENDPRVFSAQIWYPAKDDHNQTPVRYWYDHPDHHKWVALSAGLPDYLFNHLHLSVTNSHLDVALSDQKDEYPVLIFSHGYGMGPSSQIYYLWST
jgi:hypothetical protein